MRALFAPLVSALMLCAGNAHECVGADIVASKKLCSSGDVQIVSVLDDSPTVKSRLTSIYVVSDVIRRKTYIANDEASQNTWRKYAWVVFPLSFWKMFWYPLAGRDEEEGSACIKNPSVRLSRVNIVNYNLPLITLYTVGEIKKDMVYLNFWPKRGYHSMMGKLNGALHMSGVSFRRLPKFESANSQCDGGNRKNSSKENKKQIKNSNRVEGGSLPEGTFWIYLLIFGCTFGSGLLLMVVIMYKIGVFFPSDGKYKK